MQISPPMHEELALFFARRKKTDLISTYLFVLERRDNINPVIFLRQRTIYQSQAALLSRLQEEGKLWRETEIQVQPATASVNAASKKIYICPYSDKVFADNTHPNPQDAIYDWVSQGRDNERRVNGMPVKRFLVSEDPAVIRRYIPPQTATEYKKKRVYSSQLSGKLFNDPAAVVEDFTRSQLRPIALAEVTRQNRYRIADDFLVWIQQQLADDKLSQFVEEISQIEDFAPHVKEWLADGEPPQ